MEIQPFHPFVVQLFAILANVATILGVGVAIWAGYAAYSVWKEQLGLPPEYVPVTMLD